MVDGTYCFQETIGLIKAEQCACDQKDAKCWDINLNSLPADYDFYRLGGKVVMTVMVAALFSTLGSIVSVFYRGTSQQCNEQKESVENVGQI